MIEENTIKYEIAYLNGKYVPTSKRIKADYLERLVAVLEKYGLKPPHFVPNFKKNGSYELLPPEQKAFYDAYPISTDLYYKYQNSIEAYGFQVVTKGKFEQMQTFLEKYETAQPPTNLLNFSQRERTPRKPRQNQSKRIVLSLEQINEYLNALEETKGLKINETLTARDKWNIKKMLTDAQTKGTSAKVSTFWKNQLDFISFKAKLQ